MAKTKQLLTVGITVNLDNYENLRVELQGEVNQETLAVDTDDLKDDLAKVLLRFGLQHPPTRERIESYSRRVLGVPKLEGLPAVPLTPQGAPAHEEKPTGTEPGFLGLPCDRPQETPAPKPEAMTMKTPPKEEKAYGPATKSTTVPTTLDTQEPKKESKDICALCGEGVTPMQADLSRKAFDIVLCKTHYNEKVEKTQGEKAAKVKKSKKEPEKKEPEKKETPAPKETPQTQDYQGPVIRCENCMAVVPPEWVEKSRKEKGGIFCEKCFPGGRPPMATAGVRPAKPKDPTKEAVGVEAPAAGGFSSHICDVCKLIISQGEWGASMQLYQKSLCKTHLMEEISRDAHK
jgi:hypothetical protein